MDRFIRLSDNLAVKNSKVQISYTQLWNKVSTLSKSLSKTERYGLLMENTLEWILLDLAALQAEVTLIPIPTFFSDSQIDHVVQTAGITKVFTDNPDRFSKLSSLTSCQFIDGMDIQVLKINERKKELPDDISKVTFTSGSTGAPKGVCLNMQTMLKVAWSLKLVTGITEQDRHICLLPLSTLLENIAGIYTPLLAGSEIFVPTSQEVGLEGSSKLDIGKMFQIIKSSEATTGVMTPQLLKALIMYMEKSEGVLPHLKILAVGGAVVSPTLHERASALGLPVYEGYGLSECSSVVALNSPKAKRTGSVGKLLPHVQAKIADDGEILVKGAVLSGYLTGDADLDKDGYWKTGDLGSIDEDQYLYILGRKKNQIISSFGRNIEPDWIESELCAQDAILQSIVFGEAKPFLIAIIVPNNSSKQSIEEIIKGINKGLPDYAQVRKIIVIENPFSKQNGMLTDNGRCVRHRIYQHYYDAIENLYREDVISNFEITEN